MTERLEPKETIIEKFQQVNDETRALAPELALSYVHNCIAGWQWEVDMYNQSIPAFGRNQQKAAEKWQGFLDSTAERELAQEEWDRVKDLLIGHGLQVRGTPNNLFSQEDPNAYARGLMVLAASLP